MIFLEKLMKKCFPKDTTLKLIALYGLPKEMSDIERINNIHMQKVTKDDIFALFVKYDPKYKSLEPPNLSFENIAMESEQSVTIIKETCEKNPHKKGEHTQIENEINKEIINRIDTLYHMIQIDRAYQIFHIPKRTGNFRMLHVPEPPLLSIQRRLLGTLSTKFPAHECAFGFSAGRSPFQHVQKHLYSRKYLVMDIQNFFQSCTFLHVIDALDKHTTLSASEIRGLVYIALHSQTQKIEHKNTQTLQFFQNIQKPLLKYIELEHGRRLSRLLGRLAFHSDDFLQKYDIFFDQNIYIDPQNLALFHQKIWSVSPYNLESFFGLRLWVLFRYIMGHLSKIPTARYALLDAKQFLRQKKIYISKNKEFTLFDQNKGKEEIRYTFLPQGSPLSPWLANLCCYELDVQIQEYAEKHNLTYSRYADDICLSGSFFPKHIVSVITKIIENFAFRVQASKTRFLFPHQRQIVTGFVLNKNDSQRESDATTLKTRPRLPRKYLKKIRSILHYLDCGRNIHQMNSRFKRMTLASVRGHLAYIKGHDLRAYKKLYEGSCWLQHNE